jgi:hypothetical protein
MTNPRKNSIASVTPEATPQVINLAEPRFSRIGNTSFVGWMAWSAYSFFKMPSTPMKEQNLSARLDQYFSSPRKFR